MIQYPANKKLMLMILRAGTPMASMFSEARKSVLKKNAGKIWNMANPRIMMHTAISTLFLAVSMIRCLFLAP